MSDPTFLSKTAAEAIVETARYWVARSDKRPGDDYPSILGVMGPDEYTPISSNNNYTNRLAAHACGLAAAVGAQGGATKEECAQFAEYAARLPLLRRADGLVLQCEEFERYAEPRFADRWPDRNKTFAAQVSQEMLYRSKCLKQADVLMLMMLFPQEFSDAEIDLFRALHDGVNQRLHAISMHNTRIRSQVIFRYPRGLTVASLLGERPNTNGNIRPPGNL